MARRIVAPKNMMQTARAAALTKKISKGLMKPRGIRMVAVMVCVLPPDGVQDPRLVPAENTFPRRCPESRDCSGECEAVARQWARVETVRGWIQRPPGARAR